jgi:sterol desaturase/sphingolipid hydroxylase (fatty acid hydroxylase superfamily)
VRAVVINVAQAVITFGTNRLWVNLLSGASLFHLASLPSPILQGFVGWFVGTFFFYWWHRLRHIHGFWVIFHQVHHSPARIEAITAFYKHPLEILADSALAAIILYPILGGTLVQFFCRIRRAVLPFQHQNAAVGEIFHPDPGTPFDPSSA